MCPICWKEPDVGAEIMDLLILDLDLAGLDEDAFAFLFAVTYS